jgi:predicted ATP-binding protein involved in virulence
MKIRSVHIDNYKIFQNFDIDFTHNGKAQNLIVIAGINGCGKTTLMREVLYNTLRSRLKSNGFDITLDIYDEKNQQFYIDNHCCPVKIHIRDY